ncbi:unnamed protein product [Lymnaea stagnalis]|uniref:Uncharacterized protein n=1 Tax=Lymnaea stagnalis TaxID=6523 RepID=A0AAV2HQ23_LYMST
MLSNNQDFSGGLESQCSTLERAQKVRDDQGHHEAEITCGSEGDLVSHLKTCPKNPDHIDFIAVDQFQARHLPPTYRQHGFVELVRAVAEFSVRVLVRRTSYARPELYPGTHDPYPFYNFRGSRHVRLGSGWIDGVGQKFTVEDNRRCPCFKCRSSSAPSMRWGQFWVHTALHVVFNSEEAVHAECELFFDDDDDRSAVCVLSGVEIIGSCLEDTCSLRCVTHELEVVDRLQSKWQRLHGLQEDLLKQSPNTENFEKLSLIVSYPHGCSKKISVGEWTHRQEVSPGWTQYVYTTCTCPGSSGAPVYLLGQERGLELATNHPHSARCEEPGLNISGIWWERTR